MKKITGVGACEGIAIGKLRVFDNLAAIIAPRTVQDIEAELLRFHDARRCAIDKIEELRGMALKKVGPEDSMIFRIHQVLLNDHAYITQVESMISGGHVSAEYAVQQAGAQFASMFRQMESPYMQERSADVIDVSNRIISVLKGEYVRDLCEGEEPFILAAQDLLPSEAIRMDRSKVLAVVTCTGSKTSHAAILSRTMGIPTVVGTGMQLSMLNNGQTIVVDGANGVVIPDPDETILWEYECKRAAYKNDRRRLEQLVAVPSRTLDGTAVSVCANISHPDDVDSVLENGGEGIGLFRTEYLYLDKDRFPTEEEQFLIYKSVLERMNGRRVVIRTLDLGADKPAPCLQMPHEENPAMGCRAIRICLRRPEIFKTQVRALLRASAYGKLAILIPMVTSPDEVRHVKQTVASCMAELREEKIPFTKVELGIMIETPSAAILSDQFANEVDFFSFGTNDLTQYVLAVDRMNASIGELYDPAHPAVLRLMRIAAENAAQNGIWCAVCGESGSNTDLTECYLSMGITEFSVAPSSILKVRDKICSIDLSKQEVSLAQPIF